MNLHRRGFLSSLLAAACTPLVRFFPAPEKVKASLFPVVVDGMPFHSATEADLYLKERYDGRWRLYDVFLDDEAHKRLLINRKPCGHTFSPVPEDFMSGYCLSRAERQTAWDAYGDCNRAVWLAGIRDTYGGTSGRNP